MVAPLSSEVTICSFWPSIFSDVLHAWICAILQMCIYELSMCIFFLT
uniref:Uncharacterized protein n=1 Tax=Arundo donax TaxID=35708 RepID=A0A0A9FM50_ARUDO